MFSGNAYLKYNRRGLFCAAVFYFAAYLAGLRGIGLHIPGPERERKGRFYKVQEQDFLVGQQVRMDRWVCIRLLSDDLDKRFYNRIGNRGRVLFPV